MNDIKNFTLDSKVRDIYANPVGHDAIEKVLLQLNVKPWLITNPVVASISLKQLAAMTKKTVDESFYTALINLLNTEGSTPKNQRSLAPKWWKEAVIYQIYPRSFYDSNGDGIGDLQGIISKLDYLSELGVDALWLSPVYDSPNDDNGYDIRNYRQIMDDFGTMEDFNQLLSAAHSHGMRLIMDLVVNHTSDEHEWFKEALAGNPVYRDYYHLKKSKKVPNNWESFFGGSAWNQYGEDWGLHLFSKKQMDLNWDNPTMRQDVYDMIRWWLSKGVDGFRLDVINYISKTEGLPDGNEFIGKLMGFSGVEKYFYGPHLHEYLAEMQREAFAPFDAFTVGETPGVGIEMAKLLAEEHRKELDMVFAFDILEMPGKTRFDQYIYDLNYLKSYMINWQENYTGWMSLFWDNHDNPRMLSKIDPTGVYSIVLAKLLAVIQFTLRGTVFLFQGQELGAVNGDFKDISQFRDVESINMYSSELSKGSTSEAAFKKVMSGSRDHARIPLKWTNEGGFSFGEPWLQASVSMPSAEHQRKDSTSVLSFHKRLVALRKSTKAFTYGDVSFEHKHTKDYFYYKRSIKGEVYIVECNLSPHPLKRPTKPKGEVVICNYAGRESFLRPYEAVIYRGDC